MSLKPVTVAPKGMGLNDFVAQQEGFFTAEGLDVTFDWKTFRGTQSSWKDLNYFERPQDRMAYLTIFPIGTTWRANLMTYRDARDPWLHAFRHEPQSGLASVMAGLASCIGRFEVIGPVKIRPADLYVTGNYLKSGIVLVGDAFATSCPAAGTGLNKVFTDVERLCNLHIPHWLATAGMGAEKLAAFYRDPVKVACDRHSFEKAFYLRSFSSSTSLAWTVRRAAHSLVRCGRGVLKRPEIPQRALGI